MPLALKCEYNHPCYIQSFLFYPTIQCPSSDEDCPRALTRAEIDELAAEALLAGQLDHADPVADELDGGEAFFDEPRHIPGGVQVSFHPSVHPSARPPVQPAIRPAFHPSPEESRLGAGAACAR